MNKHNYVLLLLLSLILIGSLGLNNVQEGFYNKDFDLDRRIETNEEEEEITPTEIKGWDGEIGEVVFTETQNLNEEAQKIIKSYYQSMFDNLATFSDTNIKQFFKKGDSNSEAAAEFDQIYYDLKKTLHQNSNVNLHMENYLINLEVTKVEQVNDNEVVVTLNENQDIQFKGLDEPSYLNNLTNVFRLEKVGDSYYISRHEKGDILHKEIREKLNERGAEIDKRMTYLSEVRKELASNFNTTRTQLSTALKESKKTKSKDISNGTYNRQEAVKYANEWFNKRNSQYEDFSDIGGNCNNFISQCLIAGGINQDFVGSDIWESSDYSYSWILVDSFYDYSANNNEGGFKAKVDDNYYTGQIGDIIQFGRDNNWRHSVIITDTVKDEDGNVVEYLINSNSLDYKNYPVSIYGYPDVRLLKIIGNI